MQVVFDIVDDSPRKGIEGECDHYREHQAEYKYQDDLHDSIFYTIVQCLMGEDMSVKRQVVYYSYTSTTDISEMHRLPASCPPPVIPKPEKPDPCRGGFNIGEEIAETVAKLTVPELFKPDNFLELNPEIADDPEYQEFLTLHEEHNMDETTDFDTFTEKEKALVNKFLALIEENAKEKIKCFNENIVNNVDEVNITFVCAKDGAFSSIEEALQHASKDMITCQHIDCEGIQAQLLHEMEQNPDGNHAVGGSKLDSSLAGVPDFDGNLKYPDTGKYYYLKRKLGDTILSFNPKNEKVVQRPCGDSHLMQWEFVNVSDSKFLIKNADGQYWTARSLNGIKQMTLAERNEASNEQEFILAKNSDNSFFIKSVHFDHYYTQALQARTDSIYQVLAPKNVENMDVQKLYIRETCY